MESEILTKLNSIESMLLDQNILKKDVLNFYEACHYLNVSSSHLYKLTSAGRVPHYKPEGKRIYFDRGELRDWLLRNRVKPDYEIENHANSIVMFKNNRK